MINWQDMKGLHVIAKLEAVLNRWFGTEIIFTDSHGKIQSDQLSREYQFKSEFLKQQLKMNYGYEFIAQDIEKLTEYHSTQSEIKYRHFDTAFEQIKCVTAPVIVGGEFLGSILTYPYISSDITEDSLQSAKAKFKECGVSDEEITLAFSSLKKLSVKEIEYLQELTEIVAQEVSSFHEEISKREDRISELNSELGGRYRYHSMIGKSKRMQHIYNLLEKISKSESSVLVQGSNGTGKELVAKAIHFDSPRKDNVFLAVNCSAFNDNLLDSELFGHVKGAFTGALKDKKGFFEQADGGTLFLDEVGDTSPSMQVKLLRVLQEGTFLPVGATTPRKTDVRIIAATNRDLKEMMATGEFREDLYYRLNVINLQLPSLKERPEDIALLAEHFLSQKCAESGQPPKSIAKKTMEIMLNYSWPGNVRELENEIERLVVLSGQEKNLTPDLLSPRITDFTTTTSGSGGVGKLGINTAGSIKKATEELEVLMIKEGLKRCGFNKSKLAKELGMSRASLIMKVEKYELDKRAKKAA